MAGICQDAWRTGEAWVPGIMSLKPDTAGGSAWSPCDIEFAPCLDCWTWHGHLVPVGHRGYLPCIHGGAR